MEWRQPGATDPHPALRALVSRRGEVIQAPSLRSRELETDGLLTRAARIHELDVGAALGAVYR